MRENDLFLVIDMQNVYTKGGKWECLNTEGAAQNILNVIESQERRFPLNKTLFTRFIAEESPSGVWKDYNVKYASVNEDEWSNAMVPEFTEVLKKYPLYTKGVYSSISIPEVKEACHKARRVVVSGVVAECCVLSTVLALMDEGIYVIYLTDAVSGLDRPKELATELIFSGLSPLHVSMMTTGEYLEEK